MPNQMMKCMSVAVVTVLCLIAPLIDASPQDSPMVLLITDESLEQAWEPFATFKTRIGLPTKVTTVQAVDKKYEGVDIQEKIRACVLSYIDKHETKYIILGGDSGPKGSGLVPDRDTPHRQMGYRDIPTDLYYLSPGDKDWDANDDGIYGDWRTDKDAIAYTHPSGASLGRIPVRTAEDVAAYTDKIIAYETRYPTGDFASRIIYTNTVDGSEPKVRRSWDDYLSKAWEGGQAYRFFHTETSWDADKPGDYSLKTDHWRDRINEKFSGKMHMHGHGMPGFWVLEDDGGHTKCDAKIVDKLTNEDAYLVMTTVSCFTGMYDSKFDPTITETMLRAPKKGAVVIVAPSREGVPIFHNPREDFRLMVTQGKLDGTTESMTRFWINGLSPREDGTYRTIGEAFAAMKGEMARHAQKTEGYHWCQCELGLLGDPTLGFRAKAPKTPAVRLLDGPSAYVIEKGRETKLALTPDEQLPLGSRACIWMPGGVYQVADADEKGRFVFEPFTLGEEGEVSVSISGPELNVYLGRITVKPGTP